MAEREIRKLREEITKLFEERKIKLDTVVLFGSSLNKNSNNNSDIDLLFVSKDFRNKKSNEIFTMVNGVNSYLVKKFNKPFDTLFYSDVEWQNGASLIVDEARKNGRVII